VGKHEPAKRVESETGYPSTTHFAEEGEEKVPRSVNEDKKGAEKQGDIKGGTRNKGQRSETGRRNSSCG